jgi:SAM-dependent methyltransferase
VTSAVEDHYQRLLAQHYTWMLGGDIEQTARDQRNLLASLLNRAPKTEAGTAIDLGCGSGAQTLALADMGYSPVIGVDTDESLLAELRSHTTERPAVRTVHADAVTAIADLAPGTVEVAVCMGDTLLHLPDQASVTALLGGMAQALQPEGSLVLTYRDLTHALHGVDRAIPVRSTTDQIMFCFLDFSDGDTVEVHDIVYTLDDNGWNMAKSSYRKLRLAPEWLLDQLTAAGLVIDRHERTASGLWHTVARRCGPS